MTTEHRRQVVTHLVAAFAVSARRAVQVRSGGMYHAEFTKLLANNGGKKMSALTAISRKGLKLMFRIAKERRPFVPMDQMQRGVPTRSLDVLLRPDAADAQTDQTVVDEEVVPSIR